MKKLFLMFIATTFVAFLPNASAQIPRTLTVQGLLADSLSRPVIDGIHTITIRIYDKQSGGTPLFLEEFTTPVFKGLFNLTLGTTKLLPKTVGFDKPYFLGISYDGKQEMTRIPLSSVPYALIAETVPDGAITGSKIADGAITSDKLSPALVLSLKAGDKTLGNTFTPPAFVGGGNNNTANGQYSTIGAGLQNTASANYSAIIGGQSNSAGGILSVIGGGYQNSVSSQYNGVFSGYSNSISSSSNGAIIAGGYDNSIQSGAQYSFIGGGYTNIVAAQYSTIGGGLSNIASGNYATNAGGRENNTSGLNASIGGGYSNVASGAYSTIAGGRDNFTSAPYSTISGGFGNTASAENSAVLGGLNNSVNSSGAIAIGNNIFINNSANGAIVIGTGASSTQRMSSSIPNSLTVGFGSNVATFFVEKGTSSSGFGRVGIGNTNPSSLLDLNGAFTFRSMSSPPSVSPSNQGRIYFDQTLGKFRVSQDGSPYVDLISEGGGGGGGWQLTGNIGIVEGTNYVGPTQDVYLDLRAGDGFGGQGGGSSTTRLRLNTNGSIQRDNDGNPRGLEAIDLQSFRSANDQVASGDNSVLTGGLNNSVAGILSVVSGGQGNHVDGILSFIGGGVSNDARGIFNNIVGGGGNTISFDAQTSSILGGGSNEINGHEGGIISSVITGGETNTINSDYGFIGGGTKNTINGIGALIVGGGAIEDDGEGGFLYFGNTASGNYSAIVGGAANLTNNQYSFIGGGRGNNTFGDYSVVGGGLTNTAGGLTSTVSGGSVNRANGDNSTVAGGEQNYADGEFSTIPGGRMMTLTSNAARSFGFNGNSTVAVRDITIDAPNTAVWNNVDFWLTNNDGAPRSLRFYGLYDAIGAFPNGTQYVGFKAPNTIATSVTWTLPNADGTDGQFLKTDGSGALSWATAGGLQHFVESENTAPPNSEGVPVVQFLASSVSTNVDVALTPKGTGALLAQIPNVAITGGNKRGLQSVDWQMLRSNANQVASGNRSVISGGESNRASAANSTIGGGQANTASNTGSTVSGGTSNTASGFMSTISGGTTNTAGSYSAIPGGTALLLGQRSFGYNANLDSSNFNVRPMSISQSNVAVFNNVDFWLTNNDNTTRSLRMYEQNNEANGFPGTTNYVGFKAANSIPANVTWTLPDADGSDGDQLTTNGAGTLSWAPPSIPCGGIIMWQGDINNVPTGWALCDGNNGTPNLNDRFPRGTITAVSVGTQGGQDTHSHTVDDHSHTISTLTASGSVDNGTITGSTSNEVTGISATATLNGGSDVTTDGTNNLSSTSTVNITDTGHGHSVSGSLTSTSVTITSVNGSTDSSSGVGTGQADNIPAYVYVGFIMRVCAQ